MRMCGDDEVLFFAVKQCFWEEVLVDLLRIGGGGCSFDRAI